MVLEIAGFLCGVSGIAAAFWLLYRREASRMSRSLHAAVSGRQRA
jgi:hypothetical protein